MLFFFSTDLYADDTTIYNISSDLTAFLSHIRPNKHAEQDEIDAKWLGKKLAFWRESWRVDKNIIIAKKLLQRKA